MHRRLLRANTAALGAASVCGCASPRPAVHAGEPPRLELRRRREGTAWTRTASTSSARPGRS